MTFLVVLASVLIVAYGLSPEMEEIIKTEIMNAAVACKEEIGATDDDIAPMKSHEPPTTHTGKCFLACMNKKFGFLDGSGKIDKESTYAMIAKLKPIDKELYKKLKQVTDTCLAEITDDADECETAFNWYNCAERENKVVGMKHFDF